MREAIPHKRVVRHRHPPPPSPPPQHQGTRWPRFCAPSPSPADAGLFLAGRGWPWPWPWRRESDTPEGRSTTAQREHRTGSDCQESKPVSCSASCGRSISRAAPIRDLAGRHRSPPQQGGSCWRPAADRHAASSFPQCSLFPLDVSLESLITRRTDAQPELVEAAWLPEAWDDP